MTEAFERYKMNDATATSAIAQNAVDYIELLTDHIDKENNILLPWPMIGCRKKLIRVV